MESREGCWLTCAKQRTMTQFPAGHSDKIFQLKEDTVSPGAHLSGSNLGRISKNAAFLLLLET